MFTGFSSNHSEFNELDVGQKTAVGTLEGGIPMPPEGTWALGQSSYPSLVIVIVFHWIIPVFAARLLDLELEGDECSLFPRGIRLVHEANNGQT
ncbi:hypothetical protein TorRG33x02_054470 [Trema orientale]|uniref:Uncharacterized protein n=1 Tax=Trema orientale TaxID=63057 RepID=A0A2P5FM06_TREOI|nr:hypothetical protein TorRG33x02_054470 [Trema orientale]